MKYFLYFITIFSVQIANAQTDSTERNLNLNEVVVSSNKFEQLRKESPNQIELISKKQIAFQNAVNTANLLEQSGNVFVQRSQSGGGSPVLRGFEASRVLIVIDGIRMNNAIYRAGHLQNVLRIDQSMLERAEVIFGPSSVLYGSDALGGVMHFRSRNPELNKIGANAYVRYSSAISEKTGHVDLNLGGKRFGSLTSFTFSDFGDVIQGANRSEKYPDFGKRPFYVERQGNRDVSIANSNVNKQVGSEYKQYDFLQKFTYQASDKVKHILNLQYSNTTDVPRYDRLTEVRNNAPRFAEWYYGPEKRLMAAYQLELKGSSAYDKAFISAAYQDIEESRISRSFNNVNRKSQFEHVKVYSLNADFQKSVNKNTFNYGLEVVSNDVNSTAIFTTITTGAERKADTRYPDGQNKMNTWAAYLTDNFKFSDKLIGQIGLRYSGSSLSAEFIEKSFFPFPFNSIKQKSNALTGNLGLIFNPTDRTKLSILGSSGYRTPNIDDLAKVFDSVSGTLVVPNPDIKPEYTYNGEITLSQKIGDRIRIEGTYFYTKFQNAIVVDAFTLNGQSTVSYNGVQSKVMASQNKAKATVNGWNINFYANLMDGLTLSSTLNSTQGIINDDKKTPLDHIPPMFGRTGLKYHKKALQIEVFSIYNGWKKLKDYSPSGEDNLIYATADGMPSWWTLNLRTAYQVQKNIQIQMACENILDRNYRTFASGISSPGRNFVITLRGGF